MRAVLAALVLAVSGVGLLVGDGAPAAAQEGPVCPPEVAGVALSEIRTADEDALATGVDSLGCSYIESRDDGRAVGSLYVSWHFAERGNHAMGGGGACATETAMDDEPTVIAIPSPERQVTSDGRWAVTIDEPFQQIDDVPEDAYAALAELVQAAGAVALPCERAAAAAPEATDSGVACPAEMDGHLLIAERSGPYHKQAGWEAIACAYGSPDGGDDVDFAVRAEWIPASNLDAGSWVDAFCGNALDGDDYSETHMGRVAWELGGLTNPGGLRADDFLSQHVEPVAASCDAPAGGSGAVAGSDDEAGGADHRGGLRHRALIGSGLVLVAVGGGPALVRRARRTSRRGRAGRSPSGRIPPVDPFGDPIVVQDGSYEGGGNVGDVWWGGEWISPEQAQENIREQEEAIRRRELEQRQFGAETRAMGRRWTADRVRTLQAEADAERAERMSEEAERAAELARRQELRDSWEGRRDELIRQSEQWRRAADRWGWAEWGAEWIEWGADRGIDVLAGLTGPAGQTVKTAYDVSKRVGQGVTEYAWTGDAGKAARNAAAKLVIDKATDKITKALPWDRVLGKGVEPVFPSTNPDGFRDLPFSKLRKIMANPDGYAWSNETIRAAAKDASRGYLQDITVRDPMRNVADGAWQGKDIPLLEGRDAFTKTINRITGVPK